MKEIILIIAVLGVFVLIPLFLSKHLFKKKYITKELDHRW